MHRPLLRPRRWPPPLPCSPVLRAALLAMGLVFSAAACDPGAPGRPIERDLAEIEATDTLAAVVTFNETSYFVYRGTPMGFEYDLLRLFASERELALRVRVVREPSEILHALNAGVGDVAAGRIIPAARDERHVAYSQPLYETRPAVVQRVEPAEAADLPAVADTILAPQREPVVPADEVEIRARLIREPGELGGEEVHVPTRTFYQDRLVELSDSVTGEIHVVEVDTSSYETLMRVLARGEITLTVAPENVAELKQSYYENLRVIPVIGPAHPVVFGLRPNSPDLQAALDAFIEEKRADGTIDALFQRYFVDRQGFRERVESEYLTSATGRLSEYDELFRRHAPGIGWDWRLLASLAYQESRFDPRARSWAGAQGLLQIMPATARDMAVANPWDPEQNVAGGVSYLDWVTDRWRDIILDEDQRRRFVLASYNVGFGHVGDARRLAEQAGDDPDDWDDVAYWLLQKSRPEIFRDPIVRYGYARGLEPVTYVALILERYEHYLEFVTD
jgi:membrane-bound lytic murein transglycosylase F